ncbi:MAG: biopolymer transporter ExbD [Myxococcota bacterium]|jgi:biopolymer transport protein ExbD|nr:biopolymer transporter ExbD [Myxococcota bacterium]|tara:strand:- start:287 stop:727 length:441 start_codon:yes stop_codon:yes gene_type:complete
MAGGGGDGDGAIEDINVTPLVDIMLCLMVIFIIAAAMVVAAPKAIDIDLPKAASGEQKERPKTFAVSYGSKEELLFNGERVDWDTMRSRVRQAKKDNEEVQAIIAADAKLTYGKVMRLIDAIRIDGVERYALNIDHDPTTNPVQED